MENTAKNKIITFYSFKGGAGRSQLLANLSAYICYHLKKRVLIIDWDLEAPGIDKFFTNSAFRRQDVNCGLIDIFKKYVQMVTNQQHTNNSPIEEKDLPTLRQTDNEKYIYNLLAYKGNGVVDFVPAVNYNQEGYSHVVNEFDWFNFYDQLQGRYFIEVFKQHLHALPYDFVLIDSRTGISDYSGICNIQLPDINVLVTVPTAQSIEGTKAVAEKILASPYTQKTRPETVILPILSRVETSNGTGQNKWMAIFEHTFKDIITKTLQNQRFQDSLSNYINRTYLKHDNELAYGENLLFAPEKPISEYSSIEQTMLNILAYTEAKPERDIVKEIADLLNAIAQNEKRGIDSQALYLDLARLHYENGEYENALACYEKVMPLIEGSAEDLFDLGYCYDERKDYTKAKELYEKALTINPNDAKAWYNLGDIFSHEKNYHKSKEAYEEYFKLKYKSKFTEYVVDNYFSFSPSRAEYWNNLAGFCYILKDYENTKKYLKLGIAIDTKNPKIWRNLGELCYELNEYGEAWNAFTKVLEIDPNDIKSKELLEKIAFL